MALNDSQNGVLPTYARGYEVQLVVMSDAGKQEYRTVAERNTLGGARTELNRVTSQMRNKYKRGRLLVNSHLDRDAPVSAVRIFSRSEPASHNPISQINF